ncbi:nucleoprotein TPR [Eleginops maclovinus]|uniref:nucleoprotein TPR n=1 Tax=Eleginops maclovinus TaxID=56733 RepID=UPI003080D7AB
MAASKETSLPLRHLTGTFTHQRELTLKNSHLQQRWQELKERELIAQQNNRQLLQQFDEAQETLREMLTLTADMKTIRKEYERYLEESYPRWQQQLEEKNQSAQRQSMEDYLRSCLKNREERVSKYSADRPLYSKGHTTVSQQMAAPPNQYSQNHHMDYNRHGCPRLPYMQSSWQTHPQFQTARYPIRAQHQPQGYSHVPPFFPQHPDPFQHQQLASTPGHHHSRQNAPGWASVQPNQPCSLAAGAAGISACSEALWGQLYREEPPPEMEVTEEEVDTSQAPSSKRESRSGGSCRLSQELDIKPVRLSGGPAESSVSSRESCQGSKKKKRGTSQRSSLKSCSSQESSESSSAIVIAASTAAQDLGSEASSEKGRSSTSRRTRRSGGLTVGSPTAEKTSKESKGEDSGSHREESRSTTAELGSLIEETRIEKGSNQRQGDNSESCGEESGSQREEESGNIQIKIGNRGGDETEKQESNSSEQSNVEERDEEEPGRGDGEEDSGGTDNQADEEQDESDASEDDDAASERKNTTDEEEESGLEEESEDEKKGDGEEAKQRNDRRWWEPKRGFHIFSR